jgi:hypothetical protein
VTIKEQDHQCQTSTTRREDLQPRADAMEIRPADQHPVAQADGCLGQHLVVPDPAQPAPPVSRPHRRSLTCRQIPAPDYLGTLTDVTRAAKNRGTACRRWCARNGRHESPQPQQPTTPRWPPPLCASSQSRPLRWPRGRQTGREQPDQVGLLCGTQVTDASD